jgi:hypothetical protein
VGSDSLTTWELGISAGPARHERMRLNSLRSSTRRTQTNDTGPRVHGIVMFNRSRLIFAGALMIAGPVALFWPVAGLSDFGRATHTGWQAKSKRSGSAHGRWKIRPIRYVGMGNARTTVRSALYGYGNLARVYQRRFHAEDPLALPAMGSRAGQETKYRAGSGPERSLHAARSSANLDRRLLQTSFPSPRWPPNATG